MAQKVKMPINLVFGNPYVPKKPRNIIYIILFYSRYLTVNNPGIQVFLSAEPGHWCAQPGLDQADPPLNLSHRLVPWVTGVLNLGWIRLTLHSTFPTGYSPFGHWCAQPLLDQADPPLNFSHRL
jgi:hypothetical protein